MSAEISSILANFEREIVLFVHDDTKMRCVEARLQSVGASIKNHVEQGAFTTEELCLFDEQAARIKAIAQLFKSLDQCNSELLKSTGQDLHQVIAGDNVDLEQSPRPLMSNEKFIARNAAPCNTIQETLNSKILRSWFLDNVADPFPNSKTKEELIAKTNALVEAASPVKKSKAKSSPISKSGQPIDYTQCSLWFVNSRRRSHWTDFYREFARQDKNRMRRLIECLKEEEGVAEPGRNKDLDMLLQLNTVKTEYHSDDSTGAQTEAEEMAMRVKECRENYTTMMEWLHQISREKVGDWMDDVIREAKIQVKEEKAAKKVERKRRAEEIEQMREDRNQHRRKMEQDRQMMRAADVNLRQMERTSRRKTNERKERMDRRRLPVGFHTPDSNVGLEQYNDSSIGSTSFESTSWSSSTSSQYAPSLFERNLQAHSSSSSSSLASYDAFVRVPASPTLSILKNSQPKLSPQNDMQLVQMETAVSLTDQALLYSSSLAPQYRPIIASDYRTRLQTTSPAELHLETELSGGVRSQTGRVVSQSSSASSSTGCSPWNGWKGD